MKTAKRTLLFLACAAAIPAYAQNSSDSRCGMTNYDKVRNLFTIVHPIPDTVNQQCFITVVSKQSWPGGMPDPTSSKFVEGNYEITISGGGGGGGGGSAIKHGGGGGGAGAIPTTVVRYLKPGTYRMTIGEGGYGGAPNAKGGLGAPTSLSSTDTEQTIAGYTGAETWDGTYSRSRNVAAVRGNDGMSPKRKASGGNGGQPIVRGQSAGGSGGVANADDSAQDGGKLIGVAFSGAPGSGGTDLAKHSDVPEVGGGGGGGAGFGNGGTGGSAAESGKAKVAAVSGRLGGGGGGGAGGEGVAERGADGGDGFIRLVLKDPVPQAHPAPGPTGTTDYAAPAAAVPRMDMSPARPPRIDRH
jgi:hypothetical protein